MSGGPAARDMRVWADALGRVGERIGRGFKRSEPRRRRAGGR
jgi:hypothetical protein